MKATLAFHNHTPPWIDRPLVMHNLLGGETGDPDTGILYGTDTTYRWRPLSRAIYHSFAGRTESIWSRREQLDGLQRAFGFYASGDCQFGRRWFGGGRVDRADRARRDAA